MDILTIVLLFAGGLFLGLAIKKGVVSILLFIVALFVLSYSGLSIIGISYSNLITFAILEFHKHISLFHFNDLTTSLGSVIFIIGLAIGFWKG